MVRSVLTAYCSTTSVCANNDLQRSTVVAYSRKPASWKQQSFINSSNCAIGIGVIGVIVALFIIRRSESVIHH